MIVRIEMGCVKAYGTREYSKDGRLSGMAPCMKNEIFKRKKLIKSAP